MVLLNDDFTRYYSSNEFGLTSNTLFSVMLGIQFSDKPKTTYKANPLLRLGVSYFSGTSLTGSFYKEDRKTCDTLTSTQTGRTVYLDSVTTKSYSMNYSSEQLWFDGSLIFRTNPKARWSLFAGIGITAGFSINANTEIYYSKSDWIAARHPDGNHLFLYFSAGSYDSKEEKYRNKNNFSASTFIPLGINYRIKKNGEFLKPIYLFYELRPGIYITSIPELRTITNANIQHWFGLRVSWD